MSITTTLIGSTERSSCSRQIQPSDCPWPARVSRPGSTDVISLVVCFTSTDKLHERIYAPFGR